MYSVNSSNINRVRSSAYDYYRNSEEPSLVHGFEVRGSKFSQMQVHVHSKRDIDLRVHNTLHWLFHMHVY